MGGAARGLAARAPGESLLGLVGGVRARAVARVPGTADLLGPALVVRPGVEVARDRRLAGTGTLHPVQPAGIRVRAARPVRIWRRLALRAGCVVAPPVTRAHEKLLYLANERTCSP